MLTTDVAPVTIVGSPMLSGSRAGRAPKTPASYTSSRSGVTVRFARLTAMFGRPTPTKQTCWPASSRAAATIIISDLENKGLIPSGSTISNVADEGERTATSPSNTATSMHECPRTWP